MKKLDDLKKETPLGKRIFFRLMRTGLKLVPGVGQFYQLIDEGVLESLKEQEQARVNQLVDMMYGRLEPLMRSLEKENLPDEKLEEYLHSPDVKSRLEEFADEFNCHRGDFEHLTELLRRQVEENARKIEDLSQSVDKLSESLDLGKHFHYIDKSVKNRIQIQGSIEELYDNKSLMEGATGGQGVVYRAHRRGTSEEKRVALKVLRQKRTGDSRAVQRFLLEGFLSSQIIHPNIVQITDYGGFFKSREYYIEMEDLGEVTLKKWAEKNTFRENNIEEYLTYFSQALNALEAIHKENLIHRDIKPSNFMISEGRLKLIDFGSVKSLEAEENLRAGLTMTATGEMVGTPQYMSPEQFDRSFAGITAKTDIYCLGITLFEVLTGSLPFQENSSMAYGRAHMEKDPPRPSSLNPEIPAWLDNLILRMLRKEPRRRVGLATMRSLIESNRPENVEKAIKRGNDLLRKLFAESDSGEVEEEIQKLIKNLEDRLAGSSKKLQNQLKEFILDTEKILDKRKDEAKQREVLKQSGFNPLNCPNMRCNAPIEEGHHECPHCETSYMIPCVCEREELTPYIKDICQKCRDRRPLPTRKKQIHSLLTTIKKCREKDAYTEALHYFGFFPHLENHPQISTQKQELIKIQQKRREEKEQKHVQQLEEQAQNLIGQGEKEDEARRQKELKQSEEKRKSHIQTMTGIFQSENYIEAFDYYQEKFPEDLKNYESVAIFDKICVELTRPELDKAEKLIKREKFQEARKELDQIPPEYHNSEMNKKMREISREVDRQERERRKKRRKTIIRCTIAGVVIILVVAGYFLIRSWQWEREQEVFQRAENLSENLKLPEDYQKAIKEYLDQKRVRNNQNSRPPKFLRDYNKAISAYQEYVRQYKNGHFRKKARAQLEALKKKSQTIQEELAYRRAKREDRDLKGIQDYREAVEAYQDYLNRFPRGKHLQETRKRFEELQKKKKKLWSDFMSGKSYSRKALQFDNFIHMRTKRYACGGQSHLVHEYLHKKTGMEFVLVPGGSFQMGSTSGGNDEKPVHQVLIKPFLMSKTEVTQGVWKKVMGTRPWNGEMYVKEGDNYPAVYVSWNDAKKFCQKTGLSLPSEAQWEYACRAGTMTKYYWGDSPDGSYMWYNENTWDIGEKYAHKVGQKNPNAFGLYDMSGNVYEWCEDWYHSSYKGAPTDGSAWTTPSGSFRVSRGGCFSNAASDCRSALRSKFGPSRRWDFAGFRLLSPVQDN